METLGNSFQETSNPAKQARNFINISPEKFKAIFLNIANKHIKRLSPFDEFVIDDINKEVLNQMYLYLTGNEEKFKGDLYKGFLLVGDYGCGKTTLSRIFGEIYGLAFNKNVTFLSSIELVEQMQNKEFDIKFFEKRPLIIDEIGRENVKINIYGTERLPLNELLTLRYNANSYTFGTANFSYDDLRELYGDYLGERLLAMFNFIFVPGKSRRK